MKSVKLLHFRIHKKKILFQIVLKTLELTIKELKNIIKN